MGYPTPTRAELKAYETIGAQHEGAVRTAFQNLLYTPQPIVDFMVKSVEHVLKTEFGRSLSDMGVHIIDPFVGTGNFIVPLMQEIQGRRLPQKYREELHCNEVMLLPYYIASLNIEHAYFERTGDYDPYVKAFRWAMDKLGDEGIVAFVTNNSFIDAQMFDGMRKHLSEEFDTLYILLKFGQF